MGTTYFILEVDDYTNNHPTVIDLNLKTKYSYKPRNVLAIIPNSSNTNEVMFDESTDATNRTRQYFGPVRIKKLHIRLLDEFGREVNLENGEFSIKLEITMLNPPYKNMIS